MKAIPVVALCALTAAGMSCWSWYTWDPDATDGRSSLAPPVHSGTAEKYTQSSGDYLDSSGPLAGDDRECSIVRHYLPKPDGTTVEAVSCDSDRTDGAHPYEQYPSAALESLAYADAKAAQTLGMRLIEDDPAKSLSLIVRASALSGGDPAPVRHFSNAYPHPVSVDGVPQRQAVRVKFVLASVTALLAGDQSAPNDWEPIIREYSADPEQELALLHARAREIIDEMRRIQRDVSGTSTIGGPGDA